MKIILLYILEISFVNCSINNCSTPTSYRPLNFSQNCDTPPQTPPPSPPSFPPLPPTIPIGKNYSEYFDMQIKGSENVRIENAKYLSERFGQWNTEHINWYIKPCLVLSYKDIPKNQIDVTIAQVEYELKKEFLIKNVNKYGNDTITSVPFQTLPTVMMENRVYNERILPISNNYSSKDSVTFCNNQSLTVFDNLGIHCKENDYDIVRYLRYMEKNIVYYEVILAQNLQNFLTDFATVICYPDKSQPKIDISIKWLNGGSNGRFYTLRPINTISETSTYDQGIFQRQTDFVGVMPENTISSYYRWTYDATLNIYEKLIENNNSNYIETLNVNDIELKVYLEKDDDLSFSVLNNLVNKFKQLNVKIRNNFF